MLRKNCCWLPKTLFCCDTKTEFYPMTGHRSTHSAKLLVTDCDLMRDFTVSEHGMLRATLFRVTVNSLHQGKPVLFSKFIDWLMYRFPRTMILYTTLCWFKQLWFYAALSTLCLSSSKVEMINWVNTCILNQYWSREFCFLNFNF